MLPAGLRGWGSGLLHGPCWPIGSPAPPQGSLSTLSSAGLTSQRPPGLGVPSEATRAGTLQMAELLECPRQQNQRTRLWLRLCPSLFRVTVFCFFFFPQPRRTSGKKMPGLVSMEAASGCRSNGGLREGPAIRAESGQVGERELEAEGRSSGRWSLWSRCVTESWLTLGFADERETDRQGRKPGPQPRDYCDRPGEGQWWLDRVPEAFVGWALRSPVDREEGRTVDNLGYSLSRTHRFGYVTSPPQTAQLTLMEAFFTVTM